MTGLAMTFALLSALASAFSTSLQHHANETTPDSVTGVWAILRHLAHKPLWLLGHVLAFTALAMHALALHFGPIALVQPLVISGIVLAVPVRAAISRRFPGGREMLAVLIAAVGLATFVIVSSPSAGTKPGNGGLPVVAVGGCLAIAAIGVVLAQRVSDATRRAFLLGAAAGVLFALVAVLLKLCLNESSDHGLAGLFTTWPLYVLIATGGFGILSNQLAYRSGRLSSSMPVLNIVDVLVALAFGYLVFHEVPRHSPAVIAVEGLALLLMLTGLSILARDAASLLAVDALADPDPDHPLVARPG